MWADIPIAELTGYQCHDQGKVRGPRRELSEWTDERGCKRVKAAGRPYAVHLLVLATFVGPRPDGAVPRWLNGDPADNRLVNLKWWTGDEQEVLTRVNRCRNGHLYTPENTETWGTGNRVCVSCRTGIAAVTELPEVL
ncbi:Uncharacterised protein [Mycobacteroides abscessus subsp. massiliense]|uniref:HNH endonuclease n=1 Tax=Mycobacteroides abscessus TaxID=36809 RepID=UPI00092C1A09|nr:HNH endonuclease [Mycobacteroides abscessus]SHX44061.1 Uncharacterised protein [Mycobacteroides abscessus subsp. abscessus]SKM67218.1 Uncharacterised protein [Mycobacteroides abscessus subsp. massiliense]SKN33644.1 Uncharacterised protein [Mycobacteroides abscessus subsp. massiliense]SKP15550.1 Uncharacterised protein [Mycobacteroides abscessus subsp. massiliense]SKP58445.1 Uncharacterised protein [Mycobacteroides abscessus subsp. massiliense]